MVKRPLLGQFFRCVDKFLCIGSANRRLYESYGVAKDKLKPAPYCVDNDRFRCEAQQLEGSHPSIRRQWGISSDAFCVLFCGKFIAKKRPLDLIQAAHRLAASDMSERAVHLLFVGDGELGTVLRSECTVVFDVDNRSPTRCLSENLGQGGQAHFAPKTPQNEPVPHGKPRASFVGFLNQTEISQAYVAADVLVLPSDSGETWGLVVNEAMACGTPAVVSDQSGCAEDLVAPLDRRLVFRCGDVDSQAASIRHARDARFSRDRVREVADTHHLRHTVNTVAELYDTIGCR
jgi:glycosyltransferase involved in cell wall biosynthesis